MSGSSVVGLGVGVILLLILWTLTAVAWVHLSQKQSGLRIIVTLLSGLVTTTLLLIPTDDSFKKQPGIVIDPDKIKPEDAFEIYDYMFIWKAILIILMISSVFGGLAVYLMEFWSVKIHGSLPVPQKKLED